MKEPNISRCIYRHSSVRQTGLTEKLKVTIEEQGGEITAAIATINLQMTEVEKRFQDVSIADPTQERDGAEEKAGLLKQIGEEREALDESRKLFVELLAKTEQRTGVSVTNYRVKDKGSGLLAGLINTQNKYANANVNIDNVEASSGGKGIVGIAENVRLDNFFD